MANRFLRCISVTTRGSLVTPSLQLRHASGTVDRRRNVVVLGTGWAGFRVARDLDKAKYKTTVISGRNHFLFTPLLPSTAVGTLEFRAVIESIRHVPGVIFFQAVAKSIDFERRVIACVSAYDGVPREQERFEVPYEDLVVAVGAHNQTFGIPGVEQHARFLKEVEEARRIRLDILKNLERASEPFPTTEQEKRDLLSFVVVGGGPTGVEFAGELSDFIAEDVRRNFPHLYPFCSITLLEASQNVLTAFDRSLSNYAMDHLRRRGVRIRVSSPVQEVQSQQIVLRTGEVVPFGVCVWSTGVSPRPLVRSLQVPKSHDGRLLVDHFLRVKSGGDSEVMENVYALGDCAVVESAPQLTTAQAASQQAKYLAHALNVRVTGREVHPFLYHHRGMLAYLGGYRAIADTSGHHTKGPFAWLLWRSAYLTTLVSWSNKILVPMVWLKTWLFGRDISYF